MISFFHALYKQIRTQNSVKEQSLITSSLHRKIDSNSSWNISIDIVGYDKDSKFENVFNLTHSYFCDLNGSFEKYDFFVDLIKMETSPELNTPNRAERVKVNF